MFLLDTNVVSETMTPQPDPKVLAWLDAQLDIDLWICAVTVAEIRLGIELLPKGKRRDQLGRLAEQAISEDFPDRCLPFDAAAAREYAVIVAARTEAGRPMGVEDAQIAAIAVTGGLELATRNTKDFSGIKGLTVVNPWGE